VLGLRTGNEAVLFYEHSTAKHSNQANKPYNPNTKTTNMRRARLSSLLLFVMVLFSMSLLIPCIHAEEEESCMAMAEDGGEGSCNASKASTNGDDESSTSQVTTTQEEQEAIPCKDQHEKCQIWADAGECTANPSWMHTNCQRACELCADQL
jgi:hypothetical protein